MFRNPRENASVPDTNKIRPSTGRPPTPPGTSSISPTTTSSYFSSPITTMTSAPPPTQVPVLGRQGLGRLSSAKKNTGKPNQSILSFFGKADRSEGAMIDKPEPGLFFNDPSSPLAPRVNNGYSNGTTLKESPVRKETPRFNENETPVKRRRLDDGEKDFMVRTPSPDRVDNLAATGLNSGVSNGIHRTKPSPFKKRRGGFVDDSSDEDESLDAQTQTMSPRIADLRNESIVTGAGEDESEDDADIHNRHIASGLDEEPDDGGYGDCYNTDHVDQYANGLRDEDADKIVKEGGSSEESKSTQIEVVETTSTTKVPLRPPGPVAQRSPSHDMHERSLESEVVPALSREATSMFAPGDFGEDEDFENDEFFAEGEEYLERKWMQEQREMEAAFDDDSKSESGVDSVRTPRSEAEELAPDTAAVIDTINLCPICNGSMKGLSETRASTHVNACLDGTAQPLPKLEETLTIKSEHKDSSSSTPPLVTGAGTKRFHRAAIARPAQSNPFTVSKDNKGGTAFSRLMSGHAEDAAWAEAASNEAQSRGKPAYQRTCPFYKIMPGLYICVDAFRYGKVEGQNAYFLSHFHSDHYIGLTSSWCHGPIYASKVTCNLMRQQLRVDPKWLVPLEFEKKVEVPNTKGVFVTMIPANHCPGSSLYLFEKVTGKNRDGTTKMTRVLHCGDFRACPAHVHHPLLCPEVLDAVSGQTRQQVIDTCYLDTTYLTPKYAFPSQYDVIDACAQMCVSLAKEIVDSGDNWEKVKLERTGSTMTKFLEQGESKTPIKKEEPAEEEDQEDVKPKIRGRLLVVIGTYSIGKERICMGIARALESKIYAPPAKMRICQALEDAELNALLTSNPLEAQVHMQTLMEIRAETLHDYLVTYHGHFSRVVGFRPTGWSYRPPTSRFTDNPAVHTVLHSEGWKSRFTMRDLVPQRGSTKESNCFGVPYSEHSSFRELTMFCCALRINRIVPTVNVGSARSREKMKGWIDKWDLEKKKNGLYKVEATAEGWGSGDGKLRYGV